MLKWRFIFRYFKELKHLYLSPPLHLFHYFRFIKALIEEFRANAGKSDVAEIVRTVEGNISCKLESWRGTRFNEGLLIIDELKKTFHLKGMKYYGTKS